MDPTRIEEQEMTLTQPAAIRIAKLVSVITEVDHLCAVEQHPHDKLWCGNKPLQRRCLLLLGEPLGLSASTGGGVTTLNDTTTASTEETIASYPGSSSTRDSMGARLKSRLHEPSQLLMRLVAP